MMFNINGITVQNSRNISIINCSTSDNEQNGILVRNHCELIELVGNEANNNDNYGFKIEYT